MAIHALWEDRYALSVRKTAIDLSKTNADSATATSHSNTGVSNSTVGERHFTSGEANVIGQVTNDTTGDMTFGLPVIGNPGISVGQDTIEVQKTDGFATMRVGGENEASDIFRAGQSPSASFEFVATGKSLISSAALVFQNGIKEVLSGVDQNAAELKICKLPNATDGSEPQYYGTFIRKISSSDPNSHYLSDAIGTSISFRASQTEPLTVSTSLNGRIMGSAMKLNDAAQGGIASYNEGTVFGLDGKRNYLLQDSVITFEDTSGNDVVMACESFDITISSEVTPNRFNTFFPINMVLGNYTVEGSFTVPMLGKGGTGVLSYDYFMDLIADAGSSSGAGASFYTPKRFTVNWLTPNGTVDFTPGAELNFSDGTLGAGLAASGASSVTLVPGQGSDYSSLGGQLAAIVTLNNGAKAYVRGTTSDGLAITTTNEAGAGTNLSLADAADSGNKATIAPWGLNDIMMRSNCIITDCTVGGSTEATMTVSFRALNQFTAGTDDILQDAFFLAYKDSYVGGKWGYASA